MTGYCAGLASRVVEAVSRQLPRVWCKANQFSLVTKAAGADMAKPTILSAPDVPGLDFVCFISTVAGILRSQSALADEMG
jgi:hypothetical protein